MQHVGRHAAGHRNMLRHRAVRSRTATFQIDTTHLVGMKGTIGFVASLTRCMLAQQHAQYDLPALSADGHNQQIKVRL